MTDSPSGGARNPEALSGQWAAQWYSEKRVLITGGTSGIGAGIVRGFLEAGAEVVATGVTQAEVDRAGEILGNADCRVLDVRDGKTVGTLVDGLGALDIVVNCAGVIRRIDEFDPAVFEDVIDINLAGTMRVCMAARPLLARSQGAIVNLASMLSFFGGGLVPGYSASKGGIAQLTKSLAIAFAADGIRVNAIAPGWIQTPLTAALHQNEDRSRAILDRTPLKRWGQPYDLAGPVLYLCSPAAAFVTGVILPVDGGYAIF
ncbi:SDR family oxidoreductase [Microvirga sp. BT689]|uniref:SDR family NAD(P)-dependent oxidoreductase n=1 Tax=Microvirga arvi TaxID=2778731 RepID=UPI001950BE70|nr:SDR family oxidoreductase [Microvirga arvi]MBM6581273.1 SDR family oxidoreductase [Microvirga arvi]